MLYDFTLFFNHCSENFADFDEFAEKCEKLDPECHIDYDNLDVTFYNFDFYDDYREGFCEKALNSRKDFCSMARHQIKVQQEFRAAMGSWF
jgi:hypothetical protein